MASETLWLVSFDKEKPHKKRKEILPARNVAKNKLITNISVSGIFLVFLFFTHFFLLFSSFLSFGLTFDHDAAAEKKPQTKMLPLVRPGRRRRSGSTINYSKRKSSSSSRVRIICSTCPSAAAYRRRSSKVLPRSSASLRCRRPTTPRSGPRFITVSRPRNPPAQPPNQLSPFRHHPKENQTRSLLL